jgi:hypothetical protein
MLLDFIITRGLMATAQSVNQWDKGWVTRVPFLAVGRIVLFARRFIPTLRYIQLPFEHLSGGWISQKAKQSTLTTDLHLVQTPIKRTAFPPRHLYAFMDGRLDTTMFHLSFLRCIKTYDAM